MEYAGRGLVLNNFNYNIKYNSLYFDFILIRVSLHAFRGVSGWSGHVSIT